MTDDYEKRPLPETAIETVQIAQDLLKGGLTENAIYAVCQALQKYMKQTEQEIEELRQRCYDLEAR